MLASASIDFHLTDSYFVVAHLPLRSVRVASVFALFSGIHYWFPEVHGSTCCTKMGQDPVLV